MSKTPPPEPCPSKGKRKFPDRETAEASLTTIWRNAGRHGPEVGSRVARICAGAGTGT